jgi:hypothetical protein
VILDTSSNALATFLFLGLPLTTILLTIPYRHIVVGWPLHIDRLSTPFYSTIFYRQQRSAIVTIIIIIVRLKNTRLI